MKCKECGAITDIHQNKCSNTAASAGYRPSDLLEYIPANWLDPLLTGSTAVIGNPPYDCQDIERLLMAIRKRIVESR